jgi:hypothetical protein
MKALSTLAPVADAERPRGRGRLFRKYVGLFLAVVCIALLTNGLSELWFSFQEHKASLIRIQREQAEAAAAKISQLEPREVDHARPFDSFDRVLGVFPVLVGGWRFAA